MLLFFSILFVVDFCSVVFGHCLTVCLNDRASILSVYVSVSKCTNNGFRTISTSVWDVQRELNFVCLHRIFTHFTGQFIMGQLMAVVMATKMNLFSFRILRLFCFVYHFFGTNCSCLVSLVDALLQFFQWNIFRRFRDLRIILITLRSRFVGLVVD